MKGTDSLITRIRTLRGTDRKQGTIKDRHGPHGRAVLRLPFG